MHPNPEGTRKKSSKTSDQNSLRVHVNNSYAYSSVPRTLAHTIPAYIAQYTISQVVPHFIRLFHNPDEAPTRLGTLTLLCEVIDSARSSARQDNGDSSAEEPALMPFKDEVLGLYIAGLQTAPLRTVALFGLKGLASTDGLLADDEIGYIVHKVNDIIAVNQDDSDETRLVVLSALTLYSDTPFVAKRPWSYSIPFPNEPPIILQTRHFLFSLRRFRKIHLLGKQLLTEKNVGEYYPRYADSVFNKHFSRSWWFV